MTHNPFKALRIHARALWQDAKELKERARVLEWKAQHFERTAALGTAEEAQLLLDQSKVGV